MPGNAFWIDRIPELCYTGEKEAKAGKRGITVEISYRKKLPVRYSVDVMVAGGGPAGVAAAVAAARDGKSVLVVEKFSAFGGAAATMLVPAFMTFGDGEHFLAGGIGREIYDRIGDEAPDRFKAYCPACIPIETLKRIYDGMLLSAGAEILLYTDVIDAIREGDRIRYAVCAARNEIFAVEAGVYIDCTGEGDLSYYAGAESEFGDENGRVMAATLCGIWDGIDWSRVKKPDERRLEDAFLDHVFTNEDRHLPGMWPLASQSGDGRADGVGGSNAGHVYGVDPRSSVSLTKGTVEARKQLLEYRRYFREYLSGYENAELLITAPYLGIREGRRITGDYKMVLDDFIRRADFEDEIGRYSYPVDIHAPVNDRAGYEKYHEEFMKYRYGKGESYGISYRALAVKGIENLLVAGRAISSDRYMQSSLRVMPGCFITGQAAGLAASIASEGEGNVHGIRVTELRHRLRKLGAYLPDHA